MGVLIRFDYQAYDDGLKTGREWARKNANAKQLNRLFDAIQAGESRFNKEEQLIFEICHAMQSPDQHSEREFWVQQCGDYMTDDPSDPDWVRGFAYGAADFWNGLARRLTGTKSGLEWTTVTYKRPAVRPPVF